MPGDHGPATFTDHRLLLIESNGVSGVADVEGVALPGLRTDMLT